MRASIDGRWIVAAALLGVLALGPHGPASNSTNERNWPTTRAPSALKREPRFDPAATLAFSPNQGQWEHGVLYSASMGSSELQLRERGWRLELQELVSDTSVQPRLPFGERLRPATRSATVDMTFTGSHSAPRLVARERLPGVDSYFFGSEPSGWRADVPRYGAVAYLDLYDGVDACVYSKDGHPEYDVVLSPGADLDAVEIAVDGATSLAIDASGALVLDTPLGEVVQPPPVAFERTASGERVAVACAFELRGARSYGFRAPDWDGTSELELDPGLLFSTRFDHELFSVAVDAQGLIFVADVWAGWIARIDPALPAAQQVLWSVSFGGVDNLFDLFVEPSGIVTVTGRSSGGLPITPGAYDATHNGTSDVFLARFDPSLPGSQQLVWSTYLGGSGMEWGGYALFVDAAGLVTVSGATESANFPTTPGAFDRTFDGGGQFGDAYVARFNPALVGAQQLVYSTFVGGAAAEVGTGLHVGALISLTGCTRSPNFPVTAQAFDATHNGDWDCFLLQLDPTLPQGQQLRYSTFLGGSGPDGTSYRTPLCLDSAGVVTLSGQAVSPNFPTTPGAWNRTFNNSEELFVARLDPAAIPSQQLVYSTYFGGSGTENPCGYAVSSGGLVTFAGWTESLDLPVTPGAFQPQLAGQRDAFVARLDPFAPTGAQLVYSTYLGGSGLDELQDLALDSAADAVVVGRTFSGDFPITSGSPFGGGFLSFLDLPEPAVSLVAPPDIVQVWVEGPPLQTDPARTGHATWSDTCDPSPVLSYSDLLDPGVQPTEPETIVTRTWRLTDSCGNLRTAVQRITLLSPAGAGALHLDAKPLECPNLLRAFAPGTTTFSLVGTATTEVADLDLASLRLSRADGLGLPLRRFALAYLDLSTPLYGPIGACPPAGPDGRMDLALEFPNLDLRRLLGLTTLPNGTPLELVLRGRLLDGTPFEARDLVHVTRALK
ncbi:MAG: hypothetical protein HUU28_12840 [Planctomycetaceae bacterium]|nr:hypothetical protein [Planctomycetaceae bacterium]